MNSGAVAACMEVAAPCAVVRNNTETAARKIQAHCRQISDDTAPGLTETTITFRDMPAAANRLLSSSESTEIASFESEYTPRASGPATAAASNRPAPNWCITDDTRTTRAGSGMLPLAVPVTPPAVDRGRASRGTSAFTSAKWPR